MEPGIEELRTYRDGGMYDVCPVFEEMPISGLTPLEATRAVLAVSGHCFMLESADSTKKFGRYTFIGYEPTLGITCTDGRMLFGDREVVTDDPASEIRKLLSGYRSPRIEGLPYFTGGLVGYFSYDYLKYSEPTLRLDAEDTEGFKDIDLMLFDKLIVFDNERKSVLFIRNVFLDDLEADYLRAKDDIAEMRRIVFEGVRRQDLGGRLTSEVRSLFDKERFCAMVETAKHHIFEGDIFQIVLSNRLEADYEGSLFAQKYHTSMKYVGAIRKELGIRTVFNILGPLTNPASPKYMVMGVYDGYLVEPLARVISTLGVKKGMIVYGNDRLDEISCSAETTICEVKDGWYRSFNIAPEDFGIQRCKKSDIVGGEAAFNAEITKAVLGGKKGPCRDVVLLNSAAGLYSAGAASSMADGVELAANLIDSGKAMDVLNRYRECSQ